MQSLFKYPIIGILVFVLAGGCNEEEGPKPQPGENEIFLRDIEFQPSSKTISQGTTITFIQKDEETHTVEESNGLFDSGDMQKGDTFEYTFNDTGTYDIICEYHPSMTGTITVE